MANRWPHLSQTTVCISMSSWVAAAPRMRVAVPISSTTVTAGASGRYDLRPVRRQIRFAESAVWLRSR